MKSYNKDRQQRENNKHHRPTRNTMETMNAKIQTKLLKSHSMIIDAGVWWLIGNDQSRCSLTCSQNKPSLFTRRGEFDVKAIDLKRQPQIERSESLHSSVFHSVNIPRTRAALGLDWASHRGQHLLVALKGEARESS